MLKTEVAILADELRGRGWLRTAPTELGDALIANCQWRRFPAGATIQNAGDTNGGLIGLARGTVALTTAMGTADSPMTHICHAGTWFGYAPLFPGIGAKDTSAVARSDVALAQISAATVEALLARQPQWWHHIGTLAIANAKVIANIAADLMIRDSRRRCLAALLRLADCRFEDNGSYGPAEAPVSQEELAGIVNLSRSSVGTILHDLELAGAITLGYRSIILNNPTAMRAAVNSD